MTPLQVQDPQLLDGTSLKSICASPGPFLSVYLPARHPGASDLPVAPRLKSMLRSASAELAHRRYQGSVAGLLAPFESLLRDPALAHGGGDTVLFGSPNAFQRFRPLAPVTERLVVATHPYITPLLPDVIRDGDRYLLAVSRKGLRLGHWCNGDWEEVALPSSIPPTLEEFGGYGQPDHDLECRSVAGPSNGQMPGVRSGTSPGSDRADRYLHNYLRLADRELARLLSGAALVLIGVAQDVAAFRRASEYPNMLDARATGVDHLPWREIGKFADDAIRDSLRLAAEEAVNEVREATRRDHVLFGIREVLEAAHEGRVHKLILSREAKHQGLLGPLYPIAEAQLESSQDLLNAAAVETIRTGGHVQIVDPQQFADLGPIAAILRY